MGGIATPFEAVVGLDVTGVTWLVITSSRLCVPSSVRAHRKPQKGTKSLTDVTYVGMPRRDQGPIRRGRKALPGCLCPLEACRHGEQNERVAGRAEPRGVPGAAPV